MDANNTTEHTAIQTAIKYFTDRAPMNCGVMYEPYMAVVKWLQELAAFKDETPITEEWLAKYFDKKDYSYEYSDEYVEIEIKNHSDSIWSVDVTSIELDYHTDKCQVSYVGQLRQFLTLCGQGNFANQLK